jgi:hypothetical protein
MSGFARLLMAAFGDRSWRLWVAIAPMSAFCVNSTAAFGKS